MNLHKFKKIIYRFDKTIMIPLWSMVLPILIAGNYLILIIYEFHDTWYLDSDVVAIWLNISALLIIIYLSGWIINVLILGTISTIRSKLHDRYLEKHPEECTTTHDLAEDFRKLADALEEKENEDKES